MISKSRFSLIAVIMLVLLGFGFQNQAKGQPGGNSQFCPFVEFPVGWLKTTIFPESSVNFSGALIGTIENVNGAAVAGMDWQHVDFTDLLQPTPTNEVGAQAVTWWTERAGRNTYVQVTNSDEFFENVHVRILDENCNEIRDFCDSFTGGDTHVYDLSDIVTNFGTPIESNVLTGHEGFLTITTIDECSSDLAVADNVLAVTVQIDNNGFDSYGFNANHRFAVCEDIPVFTDFNLVDNGSFQDGVLGPWSQLQGGASGVINTNGISPSVPIPPCQGPDCSDPDADLFMGYLVSDNTVPSLGYGASSGLGSIPDLIRADIGAAAADDLIGGGLETNVTVVQSNAFNPTTNLVDRNNSGVVNYDLSFLAPEDAVFGPTGLGCDNYAAVCVIDVTGAPVTPPSFLDCDCYNADGDGNFQGLGACNIAASDNLEYAINPFEFQGGRSPFFSGTLTGLNTDGLHTYVVQLMSAQKAGAGAGGRLARDIRSTTGALVDNVRNVETVETFLVCDGTLTGDVNAYLTNFVPGEFAGQFNKIDDNEAGGDAVLINFADQYLPNYRTLAAFIDASVTVIDDFETPISCGDFSACYLRLGIDESIGISDDFNSPTPSGGPTTPPPTTTPPTITPTPSPTNHNNGGGGSCAIAGAPVQLGTAFANVLIPLVPIAFAFGIRATRRRRNKK